MTMKIKSLALVCSCALAFSSCMSIPAGYGPSGSYEDVSAPYTGVKRDITFSVDFSIDYAHTWAGEEDAIVAIRENFEESGLFGRVQYTKSSEPSQYHYHFKIAHTGTSQQDGMALGMLGGLSLMCIPVWINNDFNWTMSYQVRGKEVYSASSHQRVKDVLWAPAVVAMPFMNYLTVAGTMKKRPMRYFIKEIRTQRLNDIE